jgi:hypothetical protein
MATRLSDITGDLATGTERFRARVISPEVGAAYSMLALPGRQVAVTATNQPELILLTDGLTKLRHLDVRPSVGAGDKPIHFGTMAAHNGTLYVGVAWGNNVAVVAVNIRQWKVVATRKIPKAYAIFPNLCLTTDDLLAVVSTSHLSLLRRGDLTSVAEVAVDGQPVGLACAGRDIVVPDDVSGTLYRYDGKGRLLETIRYEGSGAANVLYDNGAVYGSDEETHKVFRCDLATKRCITSPTLKGTAATLARSGGLLFAALEVKREIAVLDPNTLAVRGHLPMPGGPRGFAVLS